MNNELVLRKSGFILLALFFLIVFESKALINLFGALVLLLSFIYIGLFERRILYNNPYLLVFIVPFICGLLLTFLSYSGGGSALAFLERFKFMLLVIPLSVFVNNRKELNIILAMLFISALVAIGYGIYVGQSYGDFQGFHKIGRTADMMVVTSLVSIVFFSYSKFTTEIKLLGFKVLMGLLAAICTWALIMSEMRGSWLGFGVGILFLSCLLLWINRRILIFNVFIAIPLLLGIFFFGGVNNHISRIDQQVASIAETENNHSNEARLHLWKSGWDFSKSNFLFGTGVKQSKMMFIDFFNAQPTQYQEKYRYAILYPGDYHNSYLQVYVETGGIFFLIYMLSILYPLFAMLKNVRKVEIKDQAYLVSTLVASIAFLTTQVFHGDLYHYGAIVFYLMLFNGCYILNKNKQLL